MSETNIIFPYLLVLNSPFVNYYVPSYMRAIQATVRRNVVGVTFFTFCLFCPIISDGNQLYIAVNGQTVEQVMSFIYLRTKITAKSHEIIKQAHQSS